MPSARHQRADLLPLEGEVRRDGLHACRFKEESGSQNKRYSNESRLMVQDSDNRSH